MENKMKFIPKERPMAKEHEQIVHNLHSHDKRKFGGMFYTNDGTKLHVAVNGANDPLIEQLAQKDVVFHQVAHTWEDLNTLQAAIGTMFGKHGVHTSGFLPQKNCLYIGVDNLNEDIRSDILRELRGLGYADNGMFVIVQEERASGNDAMTAAEDDAESEAVALVADEGISLAADTLATIMPGGLIQRQDSSGAYHNMSSLNFGYMYNGVPYLVIAGHSGASDDSYSGLSAYYVPPTTGYPIAAVPTSYNSSNRVKVGNFVLHNLGGNYDIRTIRVTTANLAFTHTAYNGWTINKIGGDIEVGDPLRICGVTTRYDASYEYGSCDAIQVEKEAYGTTLRGLFRLNFGANNGTSGGPVITQDSNGDIRLVGLASVNGTSQCWAMPVQYMIDMYNLSMMSEGTISV